jgi:hypothetical protein
VKVAAKRYLGVTAALFLTAAAPALGQQPQRFPATFPSQLPLPNGSAAPSYAGSTVPSSEIRSIQQAGGQQTGGQGSTMYGRPRPDYVDTDIQINTEIPSLQRLVGLRDSEAGFFERIRQEARRNLGSERVPFPEEPPLTKEPFSARPFPALVKYVEPCYVAHNRLTMEQPNWERAGWDVGFFQPAVCLAGFYWDTITMPYQCFKRPLQQTDTSAGKCLPGDLEPLVLYPPEVSITGLAAQAAAITTQFIAFPFWLVLK